MPNKDGRVNVDNKVAVTNPQHVTTVKAMGSTPKAAVVKVGLKETAMSPPPVTPVTAEADGTELLGSLTTQQQQRTSARVIKKLMLEPQVEREKRDTECETPIKVEEKELNFPTVKQRMPKALWSADEKSFFFEALNEYGKDFDAVTAYICAKMKKKGMPDLNMKTKTQVSHFYYRTWHKLSKYIQFEENVKKVSQELYALINYGELRKKLVSVNEKTCSRLGELVLCGSMMVRHRGRNVRVRTPMCRALRKLNQITEGASGARVCGRAHVSLRARNVGAWTRVQAVAHNPRAALLAPLRTSLAALIRALAHRWAAHTSKKKKSPENNETKINGDMQKSIEESPISEAQGKSVTENGEEKNDLEGHLNLEPDRVVHQELKLPKKPVLHLGPRPDAEIHLPIISPSEPLSSQKICFNSYLERMRGKDIREKIRTPKRQRKDSTTDKDKENESKKPKTEETEKLICIDDVAIDGIELMANYKNSQEDEVHASTEDEKEVKSEETADEATDPPERDRDISEIDKDMSEREKDSFSEMEDDEKFNKSDTDNESDQGKINKGPKEQIFRNLKVKFRIRPKKRGGNVYTVVTTEKDLEESKVVDVKIEGSKVEDSKADEHKEEESKPDEDLETATKQIRRGWSVYDSGDLTIGDLYLMFGSRSKLELDYWWAEATPPYHPHRDGKDRQRVEPGTDETDADLFSPKTVLGQDSNDDIPSGDEKKGEHVASPESKIPSSGSATFRLTSKLINRPLPPASATTEPGFAQLTERLKRLLSMVGNPHVAATNAARCDCGHVCSTQRKPKQQVAGSYPAPDDAPLFRHPTPIAPKGQLEPMCPELNMSSVPRWRRGRPRADQRVVVQRLLPLLPKLPPPSNLIPVNIVGGSNTPGHPQPPRILPKPTPSPAHHSPYFYAMSESNEQLFAQDGDRKIPLRPHEEAEKQDKDDSSKATHDNKTGDSGDSKKSDLKSAPSTSARTTDRQTEPEFLGQESMSLSPSRLLRDADGWLEGSVHDFSLSSFLGHLEGRPHQDQVDSQLQSLLAESSVDYVAKFADLAANVDTLVADDDLN